MVRFSVVHHEVEPSTVTQHWLHNAPVFRGLLKVALKGTLQCDLDHFRGELGQVNRCFR